MSQSTSSSDLASIPILENLTLGEQKLVSINSSQLSSFMPAKHRTVTGLEDLPVELMSHIIKFLPERSRQQFKLTSKRINSCCRAYVHTLRENPPKGLKSCRDVDPCNVYWGVVFHECICRPRIAWENTNLR